MFSGCQPRQVVQIHKTLQIPTPISIIRLRMKESETSVDLNHVTRLSAREDFTELVRKSSIFNGNRRFITVFAQSKHQPYPEPGEPGLRPLIIFLQESSHLLLDVPSNVFVQFPHLNPESISVLTHTCDKPHASRSALFNHPNNIWRRVQNTVLPTLPFSPTY